MLVEYNREEKAIKNLKDFVVKNNMIDYKIRKKIITLIENKKENSLQKRIGKIVFQY